MEGRRFKALLLLNTGDFINPQPTFGWLGSFKTPCSFIGRLQFVLWASSGPEGPPGPGCEETRWGPLGALFACRTLARCSQAGPCKGGKKGSRAACIEGQAGGRAPGYIIDALRAPYTVLANLTHQKSAQAPSWSFVLRGPALTGGHIIHCYTHTPVCSSRGRWGRGLARGSLQIPNLVAT